MSAAHKSPATSRTALGFVPWALCVALAWGCGASPRSMAVDATTVAHDVVDKATPVVEQKCVVELPTLKEPQWSERAEVCDVVVPAHDALGLAVIAAKNVLAATTGDVSLLALAAELATAVADFSASMAKLGGAK